MHASIRKKAKSAISCLATWAGEFSRGTWIRTAVVLPMPALIWALTPTVVSACEVCWGASIDTPTTRGIGMAMLSLIAMTGLVGGGIGAFFYNMKRRADLLEPGDLEVTESGDIHTRDDADESSIF